MTQRFAGKVVALTAAASGIGLSAVKRFATEGALISASDLSLEALTAALEPLNLPEEQLMLRQCDVTDIEQVRAFIDESVQRFGQLDVLVNNAGLGALGYVTELEEDAWHKVISVTLDSVFYACRAAMPHLARTQGTVVNTASISGLFGDSGLFAYNAAKGGVVNLTRALAVDHAPDNVRVNAVCPGLTATPRTAWMMEDAEIKAEYDRRLPMGRAGTPDEMASAIAFLASSDASYVTGVNLVVDGGLTAATNQPAFRRLRDT